MDHFLNRLEHFTGIDLPLEKVWHENLCSGLLGWIQILKTGVPAASLCLSASLCYLPRDIWSGPVPVQLCTGSMDAGMMLHCTLHWIGDTH